MSALRRSVDLNPNDAEAWSKSGVPLRRIGTAESEHGNYDVEALVDSRDSYAAAHRLNQYDLYPALNVARLDILLSKWHPERYEQGRDEFIGESPLAPARGPKISN